MNISDLVVSDDVRRLNPHLYKKRKRRSIHKVDKQSNPEAKFAFMYRLTGGAALKPEYVFDEVRNWRFDFAHPDTKIAVEIDGGIWSNGRHVRGQGYSEDCIKLNKATAAGWRIFRFPAHALSLDDARMVADAIRTTSPTEE
jgi:hypothetical protein